MLDVTYPSPELVKRYLLGPVNTHLAKLDEKEQKNVHNNHNGDTENLNTLRPTRGSRVLSESEAIAVAEALGGCLTDVNYLISCAVRGVRPEAVISRLIADSANQMADFLENVLHAAAVAGKDAKVERERYEGLWQMMELFVARPVVPRSEVAAIFADDPTYLDKLEAARLLLYIENPLAAVAGADAMTWQVQATPALPRLRCAWRLLLADSRMQEQRAGVKAALKRTKAKGDRKELQEELGALAALRRDAAAELAMLVKQEEGFRRAYGEHYEAQQSSAVQRLAHIAKQQESTERQLEDLNAELEAAKKEKKKLKKKEAEGSKAEAPPNDSLKEQVVAATEKQPGEAPNVVQ